MPHWAAFDWESITGFRRHHLPHITQRGAVYFITFRLNDSIPGDRLSYWKRAFNAWSATNPPPHSAAQLEQLKTLGFRRVEKYLNGGHGACFLRKPECRAFLQEKLHNRDGHEYQLGDYAILPNHVHVILRSDDEIDLGKAIGAWKSISAREINRLLCRSGSIWQDEWFDHIVRSPQALAATREYIKQNPARLPKGSATVGCGSFQ